MINNIRKEISQVISVAIEGKQCERKSIYMTLDPTTVTAFFAQFR